MSQPIIHRLLVVSPAQRFNEMLVSRLPASRFASPVFVKDASDARRRIIEESFDVILINTAAKEESSIQLALDMADRTACGILLLVRQEQFIHLESQLTERGVYVGSEADNDSGPAAGHCNLFSRHGKDSNAWNRKMQRLKRKCRRFV